MTVSLGELLKRARERRQTFLQVMQQEDTDAWRLFHGSVEGRPGLTVDVYGQYLLAMVFWGELSSTENTALVELAQELNLRLLVWQRHRNFSTAQTMPDTRKQECVTTEDSPSTLIHELPDEPSQRYRQGSPNKFAKTAGNAALVHEQGQVFLVSTDTCGKDPYLYLDFRAGRRWLRQNTLAQHNVLNLFAYTCSAGIAAASSGARVVNVDFATWSMEIGKQNAKLNGLTSQKCHFWREDVFPVIRQLADLGVKGRGAYRRYLRVQPEKFDIIVLDPPTVAVSPFGKVDIKNDYPALLKPCLLCLQPGGRILATNHHSEVIWDEWLNIIERTASKIGLTLSNVTRLYPDEDFPTLDGEQPLKMAVISL